MGGAGPEDQSEGLPGLRLPGRIAQLDSLVRDGAAGPRASPRTPCGGARWAVAKAEAADDVDALATAYFVLGWAFSDLGTESAEPHWQLSDRWKPMGSRAIGSGMPRGSFRDLGVACQRDNRWDDALSRTMGAPKAPSASRSGSTVDAEVAHVSVAEIPGRSRRAHAEAEALLPRIAAGLAGPAVSALLPRRLSREVLGRVAARARPHRRGASAASTRRRGRISCMPELQQRCPGRHDARIAECRIFLGDADAALESTVGTLERSGRLQPEARGPGWSACAESARCCRQAADLAGARQALEASLAGRPDAPRFVRDRPDAARA